MLALAARRQRLGVDQATLRDLASEIEWAKVSNVGPDTTPRSPAPAAVRSSDLDARGRWPAPSTPTRRSSAARAGWTWRTSLLFGAGLLADNEAVAAQVRRQYKWFVVDEFQDVSPLQYALLDLWLGGRDELCVVGDPAQTIYSFAGADARYLREFTQRFPSATSVELVRNYRSTPEVVAAANRLLAGTPSKGVDLVAQRPAGARDHVPRGHRRGRRGRRPSPTGSPRCAPSGTPASQMAVLFRINAQSERFEEALAARGDPLRRTRRRPLLRPGRGAAGDHPRPRAPPGSGEAAGPVVRGGGRPCCPRMGHSTEPPEGRGEVRNRWESLQALVDLSGRLRPRASRAPASATSSTTSTAAPASSTRRWPTRVTLATIHSAKGLEWDAVFVAGMHEKMMPITRPRRPPRSRRSAASSTSR